jgi:hypothetical protein
MLLLESEDDFERLLVFSRMGFLFVRKSFPKENYLDIQRSRGLVTIAHLTGRRPCRDARTKANGLMKSQPVHDGASRRTGRFFRAPRGQRPHWECWLWANLRTPGGRARGRHRLHGNFAQRTGLTISRNMGSVRQNSVRISLRDLPLSSRNDRSLSCMPSTSS